MFIGIAMLVIFTGAVIYLAVDAIRWRSKRRVALVALAVPFGAASCCGLWLMVAAPELLNSVTVQIGTAPGFGPGWRCVNVKATVCWREFAPHSN